ncbi:inactive tyrosine-protein kinase PRAG1 [Pantherophis guttatus]|uniref:Inactive tyrosine-protein kinase PRAG1 n=1 Tax=Pantherophis guttatus TaxID=94885 RepID=A0ABM3ZCX4_PANGU|nr:inactive tyrosine-protein kinase PRAG1 [Pantherophis guttatus]
MCWVQRAVEVKQEGLKMSVCSDFVEHIWKPGSCKNCFCPRSFHQLQAPSLNQQGCSEALQDLNGIGAKVENTPWEDESLISLSYSKPTIAVKPTMITSDAAGVWADGNLNTDVSQGNEIKRKPQNIPEDRPLFLGPSGLERAERNISYSKEGQDPMAGVSRITNFGEDKRRVLNSFSNFHVHDSVYNPLNPERDLLACPTDTGLKSSSSFDLSQGSPYCLLVRTSDQIENKPTDSRGNSREQQSSFQGKSQNEPIYAESSKRKKMQHNNTNTLKSGVLTISPSQNQHDGMKTLHLSCERNFQDPGSQRTATITIMAPQTEDDHRAFFLSSPDSAVGVQWPCVSPTISPDTEKSSSFFEPRVLPQERCDMNSRDKSPEAESPMSSKNMIDRSPAIPPKLSKGSPPRFEESLPQSVNSSIKASSSIAETWDTSMPRSETDGTVIGPLSPLCSQMNSISPDESSRGPLPSGSERRPKYYHASWHRPCRIEEEEEEEQRNAAEMENEITVSPSFSVQIKPCPIQAVETGEMNQSTTFAFDEPGPEEVITPRLPPKKPPRRHLQTTKNGELEQLNSDSTESLRGSTASLNLDTNPLGSGGELCKMSLHSSNHTKKSALPSVHFSACLTENTAPCKTVEPPPLPQKKTVSRALSSPDGFYWGSSSPSKAAVFPSLKLNSSQSESNVCIQEKSLFCSNLGINHHTISSSESLGKNFIASTTTPFTSSAKNSSLCGFQDRNLPSRSSSQHSISNQVSSGSSLQLHSLFSNINSKEGIYTKLGGLYAESLRRLVSKCEEYFMHDQKSELRFSENYWPFFKLTCNKPCCNAGDAVYFCATCAKDPSSTYAVKICTYQDIKAAASCISPSIPVHFNIQQDCGHFVATVPSSMVKNAPMDSQCPSHVATEQECVVVITREVPHQTAADFVGVAETFHKDEPDQYERRVCFLLLQLCNGLEHLKEHNVIHRDLCLENLLLVRCKPFIGCGRTKNDKHLPRLLITNFLKAMQKPGTGESKAKKNQARLAPEIVSASQFKKFDEFQTGILIYELLHQPNPFEVQTRLREQGYNQGDLPALPNLSIYSSGLQKLAHLLLEADPIRRIHITEAKRILQCLLWGPRKDIADQPLKHKEALHGALQNWIDMKRALLMMKFAERAVDAEHNVQLEDWLCCQYLASANPSALFKSLKLLHLL